MSEYQIKIGKVTEIIFNDVVIYSFESNTPMEDARFYIREHQCTGTIKEYKDVKNSVSRRETSKQGTDRYFHIYLPLRNVDFEQSSGRICRGETKQRSTEDCDELERAFA